MERWEKRTAHGIKVIEKTLYRFRYPIYLPECTPPLAIFVRLFVPVLFCPPMYKRESALFVLFFEERMQSQHAGTRYMQLASPALARRAEAINGATDEPRREERFT